MPKQQHAIQHLAQELQHWLWQRFGDKTPSVEEIHVFADEHLKKYGLSLYQNDVALENADPRVAALLKPSNSNAKRMRELAGIPHKDNFV